MSDFSGSKLNVATGLAPVGHNVVYAGNVICHSKNMQEYFYASTAILKLGGKK
jgi:hypothetical protein